MKLKIQNLAEVVSPTEKRLRTKLAKLQLASKHECGILEDDLGNYVQVAGGGTACMIEHRTADPLRHFRGYHLDGGKSIMPEGARIRFAGYEIALHQDEWMIDDQVADVFVAFLHGQAFPDWLGWRDISDTVGITQEV